MLERNILQQKFPVSQGIQLFVVLQHWLLELHKIIHLKISQYKLKNGKKLRVVTWALLGIKMTQRVNLSSADDQTITLELAKLSFKPEADAGLISFGSCYFHGRSPNFDKKRQRNEFQEIRSGQSVTV